MISVVIPVFNRPASAIRSIRSALAQSELSRGGLEVIVVDDGSAPAFRCEHDDARVKIVRLQRNSGASAARNAGIRAAQGEYVAFLDSDDLWLPQKLHLQREAITEIEQSEGNRLQALVCGFYSPNRVSGQLQSRIPRVADRLADFVSGCWFCPGSALFIRRSAFDVVGLLDERLRRLEDLDWFVRFGKLGGRLHVLAHAGVIVAPSNSARSATIMSSTEMIERKFGSGGEAELPASEFRRLRAYLALERGAALILERERLKGLGHLLQSFWFKPRLRTTILPFWLRSDHVPQDVQELYETMSGEARLSAGR